MILRHLKVYLVGALILLSSLCYSHADQEDTSEGASADTFTSADGRSIQGIFISADDAFVIVERLDYRDVKGDPMKVTIPLEMLDTPTRKFVEQKRQQHEALEAKIRTLINDFPAKTIPKPVKYTEASSREDGTPVSGERTDVDPGIYRRYSGYVAKIEAANLLERIAFIQSSLESDLANYAQASSSAGGAAAQRMANRLWLEAVFQPYFGKFKDLAKKPEGVEDKSK